MPMKVLTKIVVQGCVCLGFGGLLCRNKVKTPPTTPTLLIFVLLAGASPPSLARRLHLCVVCAASSLLVTASPGPARLLFGQVYEKQSSKRRTVRLFSGTKSENVRLDGCDVSRQGDIFWCPAHIL